MMQAVPKMVGDCLYVPLVLAEKIPGGQDAFDHIIEARLLHLLIVDCILQLRAPENVGFSTVREV
jgi:hypothetical protein